MGEALLFILIMNLPIITPWNAQVVKAADLIQIGINCDSEKISIPNEFGVEFFLLFGINLW